MKKLIFIIFIVVCLLASCTGAPAGPAATPTPSVEASATPTATPTPSPSPSPTATATATPSPTPTPIVKLSDASDTVNIRKGPGTNTDKLGELKNGDPVNVVEQGDVWHKILYNGQEAYVFAAYVTNLPVKYAYVPELKIEYKGKTYVSKMVDVRAVIPDIKIWLTFASQDNVFHKVMYPAGACLLQESTAKKLAAANELFKKDGYRIRLYDGYRPKSVSEYMYGKIRDGRFVAKNSVHNRGAAVDITLERISTGEQIPMPSLMHTFNISSFRELPKLSDYTEGTPEYDALLKKYPDIKKYWKRSSKGMANMRYMTRIMKKVGFTTIASEWWHYNDKGRSKFMILNYDLKKDVQWIPAEEYQAFMAQKATEGPLTKLPDYVVFPDVGDND